MTLLQISKEIPRVFAHSICRECGGKCCKTLPGATTPEQFGAPDKDKLYDNLSAALASGHWAVDWWEGHEDGEGYYVRPATVGDTRVKSPSWGGECNFLTSTGCSLKAANRPSECVALEPGPGGEDCHSKAGGKRAYADRWKPYWAVVERAIQAVGQ